MPKINGNLPHTLRIVLLMIGIVMAVPAVSGDDNTAAGRPTLQACDSSPNCVSSMDERDSFHVAPLVPIDAADAQWWQAVQNNVSSQKGFALLESTDTYLHFTFTSRLMKYVDDVELLWDQNQQKIHIRSASRKGYYDLGANRRRVKNIGKWLKDSKLIH